MWVWTEWNVSGQMDDGFSALWYSGLCTHMQFPDVRRGFSLTTLGK